MDGIGTTALSDHSGCSIWLLRTDWFEFIVLTNKSEQELTISMKGVNICQSSFLWSSN